jgi:hypothetical protein
MAKPKFNLYDCRTTSEPLFDSIIVEFNDIAGIEVEFWILDPSINYDTLYGESTEHSYLGPYTTKVVYEVSEEETMTNTFGIVGEEMIQYAEMPKTTFTRDVTASYEPKPGDVIGTTWNDRAYEIVDVHEEAKIFHLNKLIWGFILKPFRFSATDETGFTDGIISPDITPDTWTDPLTAYGDNVFIEEESDDIHSVPDSAVYGY